MSGRVPAKLWAEAMQEAEGCCVFRGCTADAVVVETINVKRPLSRENVRAVCGRHSLRSHDHDAHGRRYRCAW